MLLHLGDGTLVDQRPERYPLLKTVTHRKCFYGGLKLVGKRIVDTVLHQYSVGANARLAGIAEFGCHDTVYCRVQIGVVKDNEGRISPQLHGDLLDSVRAALHQLFADFGGTGEGQLAYRWVVGQLVTDYRCLAGDDIQYPLGDARLLGQLSQCQGGKGRRAGWLDHDAATRCQRGACLAGDHGVRKVPGGNGGDDTNRLLEHQYSSAFACAGNDVTIDPLGLFGEPLDEGRTISDLAARLGQWLALFQGQQLCQGLLLLHAQVKPAAQNDGTSLGGKRCPSGACCFCRLNGCSHFLCGEARYMADEFTVRRVMYRHGTAVASRDPGPIDITLLT